MTQNSKNNRTLADVRIIGIFAHVDAGKTTTSEAILYNTGRIHRAGSVDDGNTQLDYLEQERERGITITSAATACHWRDHRINLIDTPGHIDFSAEVVRSIRVIDGAVVILCGVSGVEPQTEAVWMHADRERLPRILFINKLDRTGADFDRVMGEIRDQLTPKAIALQLPIGREGDFIGMVDLLTEQALVWRDGAERPAVEPVPAVMQEQVSQAREALLDTICETDDDLLMQWLEGETPDLQDLQRALRRATLAGTLVPVMAGSTRNQIGVQPLLDAVVEYLPAPTDMRPVLGVIPGSEEIVERTDDPAGPLCASVFKIVSDPHVGHLTWVRVFSGRLGVRDSVYNPRTGTEERVGRIYRMHGNEREQVDHLSAGDVVALVGVKSAVTGDTLCDADFPIVLESYRFPEPVIAVALKAQSVEERERLSQSVTRLCSEDPTLSSQIDPETGELTLAGLGELHLDVTIDRLRTEFGIVPQVSQPQVSYRETVQRTAEAVVRYKKQSGGRGHFAEIELRIEPLEAGMGVVFENAAPPASFPSEFVKPTEQGVRDALARGIVAGYPLTDVRVTLLDGKFHEVDSAAMDFEIAGSMGVREAVLRAAPVLLEPIMAVDMNVNEEYLGAVVADLGRRRGTVQGIRMRENLRNIKGRVPLSETFGYATNLRSLTSGRGTFSLEFDQYHTLPEALASETIRQRREAGKILVR
jgi:elongation factor G